jgi:hypothetical protein
VKLDRAIGKRSLVNLDLSALSLAPHYSLIMGVDHSDDEQGTSVQHLESVLKGKKKTASETYSEVQHVDIDI